MVIMLIPDLLNILFDQCDYPTLALVGLLNKCKTRYANKYSLIRYYDIFDNNTIKNIEHVYTFGGLKLLKSITKVTSEHDLLECVLNGQLELVKYAHINVDESWYDVDRVFGDCVIFGHVDALRYFFTVGHHGDLDEHLLYAAGVGNLEIVKFLINHGADVNAVSHFERNVLTGVTFALDQASSNNRLSVVEYLVDNGADIHACNDSAVVGAVDNGNLSIVKYLVGKGAKLDTYNNSPITLSVINGDVTMVKYLIEMGVVIDLEVALVDSISGKHWDLARYLISIGATMNDNLWKHVTTDNNIAVIQQMRGAEKIEN